MSYSIVIDKNSVKEDDKLERYSIWFLLWAIWDSILSIIISITIYIIWALLLHYGGLHFAPTVNSSFVVILFALTTYSVRTIVADNSALYREISRAHAKALKYMESIAILMTSGIKSTTNTVTLHMEIFDCLIKSDIYGMEKEMMGISLSEDSSNIDITTMNMIDKVLSTNDSVSSDIKRSISIEWVLCKLLINMRSTQEITGELMKSILDLLERFNTARGDILMLKKTKYLPQISSLAYAGLLLIVFFLSPELISSYGNYYGFAALMVVVIVYHITVTGSDTMSQIWVKNNIYSKCGAYNMNKSTQRTVYKINGLFYNWKAGMLPEIPKASRY